MRVKADDEIADSSGPGNSGSCPRLTAYFSRVADRLKNPDDSTALMR